jgi:hypothetical protein
MDMVGMVDEEFRDTQDCTCVGQRTWDVAVDEHIGAGCDDGYGSFCFVALESPSTGPSSNLLVSSSDHLH